MFEYEFWEPDRAELTQAMGSKITPEAVCNLLCGPEDGDWPADRAEWCIAMQ